MSTSAAVAALMRAKESWEAGDLEGYLRLYREDTVLHGYAGVEPGIASIRAFYQAFFSAFPGSKLSFDDLLESGDKLTLRFVVTGRHEGPFQGLAATHREFSLPAITILRFVGDQCVERWSQADFLSLLQQLGAMPA